MFDEHFYSKIKREKETKKQIKRGNYIFIKNIYFFGIAFQFKKN